MALILPNRLIGRAESHTVRLLLNIPSAVSQAPRLDAFQLIDAFSAALFGLLGIWAAVVRRHWFLRVAVVGTLLLTALFIPAYEVVIQFSLQMAIIAAVINWVRERRLWPRRFSLEAALLAMVVVAVVAAVGSSLPTFDWSDWFRMIGVGVVTSYASLLGLWFVYGARWRVRLAALIPGVAALPLLLTMGFALEHAISGGPRFWQYLGAYLGVDTFVWGLAAMTPTVLLGMATMIGVLGLARASGWFTTRPLSQAPRLVALRRGARVAMGLWLLAVLAPMVAMFVELMTPAPLPAIQFPSPNGYDDFIAAGKLVPDEFRQFWSRPSKTPDEARRRYASLEPAYTLIAQGVGKDCRAPWHSVDKEHPRYDQDNPWLINSALALYARTALLQQLGRHYEACETMLLQMARDEQSTRGGGVAWQPHLSHLSSLRPLLRFLGAAECRHLASELLALEKAREPFESRLATQQLIDENGDWHTHARSILSRWSGIDPYVQQRTQYLTATALFRLIAIDAALQAWWLEHGRPPESLDQLAGEYLPEVPVDPHTGGQFLYSATSRTYRLASVGPNSRADAADEPAPDDIVLTGPHTQPYVTRAAAALRDRIESELVRYNPSLSP